MSTSGIIERVLERSGVGNAAGEVRILLEEYVDLVISWDRRTNLVRYESIGELWDRHVLEPLVLLSWVGEERLVDLGAGAGFASIPLMIARRGLQGTVVESRSRRVAFLRRAGRRLRLPMDVVHDRLERWIPTLPPAPTLMIARALPRWEILLPPVMNRPLPGCRLALFTVQGREDRCRALFPQWSVERTIPVPDRRSQVVVLLRNVSRETCPPS